MKYYIYKTVTLIKLFCPPLFIRKYSIKKESIGFVVDYDHPEYHKMQFDIAEKVGRKRLVFITKNKKIKKKLMALYPECPVIQTTYTYAPVKLAHLKLAKNIVSEVEALKKENVFFEIEIIISLLIAFKQIDYYEELLEEGNFKSIITLNDTHPHEFIIANVASQKGISTFTLQHGAYCKYYVPVSSDKIFVWGDANRREILELGEPEEKVVVAGKPQLDRILRDYKNHGEIIRHTFALRYNFDPSKYILAFFPTRYGYKENRVRFECFAEICRYDVSPLIKLRPGISKEEVKLYKKWLDEFGLVEKVPVLSNCEVDEILMATDILLTTESSVSMEALPFSVIVIILDVIDYIDLESWMLNYKDSAIVKNKRQLNEIIERLTTDKYYFTAMKKKSYEASAGYFKNSVGWDASSFIADYINNYPNTIKKESSSVKESKSY